MTPQTHNLFRLEGVLFELLEAREEAAVTVRMAEQLIVEGEEPQGIEQARAELAAIEHGITQFVAQQLRDVDGLRGPLKALEQGVSINKTDAAAATNRAIILQNRYDKLKDLIRSCMIALDQAGEWKPKESRKFESARGSFSLRGNGGAQPVEIVDEAMVPVEYQRAVVTMPAGFWNAIVGACLTGQVVPANVRKEFATMEAIKAKTEVSKSALADALIKPCGPCKGTGLTDDLGVDNCPHCGGSGTAGVPGARLLPRGVSVQIK